MDQVDQLESAQVKVHLGHLKAPNSAISQGKVGIDSRHLHLPAALDPSEFYVIQTPQLANHHRIKRTDPD